MKREKQIKKAIKLRELHEREGMLLMPYVWNGGSARIHEKEGWDAICTTSAGIGYSMGYPDGEVVTFDDVVRIVREIVRVVDIPLSVDMELGYGSTPSEIKENVMRIVEAGAVGINIEDGYPGEKPHLEDLDKQLEKLRSLKELRDEIGVPFFINARTCVYWLGIGDEEERLEEAVRRGNEFLRAGGDCVFIPGRIGSEVAKKLVQRIEGPVNLIVNPDLRDIGEAEEAGVKRLCMGSGAARIAIKEVLRSSEEFKKKSIDRVLDTDFTYEEANKYFQR